MSAEPVITLDDDGGDWNMRDWCLGIEINGITLFKFDDLGDGTFNIHHLDEKLATFKEELDAQNSDGQLRLRYK